MTDDLHSSIDAWKRAIAKWQELYELAVSAGYSDRAAKAQAKIRECEMQLNVASADLAQAA